MREPPCIQSMHDLQSRVLVFMLSLRLLWVPWATLCFAQWANGGVPVNLLVTGQACLHGWWLLLPKVPLSWRSPLVDKLLSCRCCCSQLRGDWRRRWLLWLCFHPGGTRSRNLRNEMVINVNACLKECTEVLYGQANSRAHLKKVSVHTEWDMKTPISLLINLLPAICLALEWVVGGNL